MTQTEPSAPPVAARPLDFIVIGSQKAGTTSLWRHLQGHPSICLPDNKEAPFFIWPGADDPAAYAEFVAAYFPDVPPGALIGTVTPHYMMGHEGVSAEGLATLIVATLPNVRVIALLRDPIERAMSHYRMSIRRGIEHRTFERAAEELLVPEQLVLARSAPDETNSYLVQGEYGRILSAYYALMPRQHICVLLTRDLEQHPAEVLDDVLRFLGLPPGYRPSGLYEHHHRGGSRPRLDPADRDTLLEFLERNILPHCPERDRAAFHFFFETWNVIPDDETPSISPSLRAQLEAHFAADAARLKELGISVPWERSQSTDEGRPRVN